MLRHITAALLFCFGWMLTFVYVTAVWIKGMHLEMQAAYAFTTRSIFIALVELSLLLGGLFLLGLSAYALSEVKPTPVSPLALRLFWASVLVAATMFSVWFYVYAC